MRTWPRELLRLSLTSGKLLSEKSRCSGSVFTNYSWVCCYCQCAVAVAVALAVAVAVTVAVAVAMAAATDFVVGGDSVVATFME